MHTKFEDTICGRTGAMKLCDGRDLDPIAKIGNEQFLRSEPLVNFVHLLNQNFHFYETKGNLQQPCYCRLIFCTCKARNLQHCQRKTIKFF